MNVGCVFGGWQQHPRTIAVRHRSLLMLENPERKSMLKSCPMLMAYSSDFSASSRAALDRDSALALLLDLACACARAAAAAPCAAYLEAAPSAEAPAPIGSERLTGSHAISGAWRRC